MRAPNRNHVQSEWSCSVQATVRMYAKKDIPIIQIFVSAFAKVIQNSSLDPDPRDKKYSFGEPPYSEAEAKQRQSEGKVKQMQSKGRGNSSGAKLIKGKAKARHNRGKAERGQSPGAPKMA